ncbi:hypothetical protein [Cellulomonas iranensis]|uniref:YobI family P-loop NTPase n=1 Tax=Cellulomonas iranensis TaxID=76862 RepID=UPI0013D8BDC1|nr:hypothetical protein [Cellulomonas iranensis]
MSANLIPESPDPTGRAGGSLRLASLAPQFDTNRHQVYFDLLIRAIDAPSTRNIALTGAYGTGKSSVLSQLRKERAKKVVELSLSTIAPELHDYTEGNEERAPAAGARTNQIQKEIVKQLLYRLRTDEVPRSRFRRASEPNRRREWGAAAAWGLPAFGVLLALGLIQPAVEGLLVEAWRQIIAYLLGAGLAVCAAWMVVALVRGRPTLAASVNAGPAMVTLSKSSETYFDEYLDEIVYYFQVSACDIVVIEDIDRFEDVQVFDTLRALNGLLNSSEQVGRRVVFVYAIRDSVFEQVGGSSGSGHRPTSRRVPDRAKLTLERASRTKFFDLIIPLVPFVSADNARDVMSDAMSSDEFTIDPALIRVAARHVADMRLIQNVRNEFEVYRNRLVVPETSVPGITDDLVFAIVLYKNTHLSDFELIRHQRSTLDQLYEQWRKLVSENLTATSKRLAELRRGRHRARSASARAAELGQRLADVSSALHAAARAASGQFAVSLAGGVTTENLIEPEAWKGIAAGDVQLLSIQVPSAYYGPQTYQLPFDRELLERLLGTALSADEWEELDIAETESAIAQAERKIDFLRHHTWQQLCEEAGLTLPAADPDADEPAIRTGRTFDDLIDETLESDLARDLVRHGFLTSHFALYTSSYYGQHLSRDAMEYITRCIEPGEPDITFTLDDEDVVQILREQGAEKNDTAELFTDPSVYNVSILNYLLAYRQVAAAVVARKLARLGDQERRFIDSYVSMGEHSADLLGAIAPYWQGVVRYVATEAPVDPEARRTLLDAVLAAIPSADYEVDDDLRATIEAHYRDLNSISRPGDAGRAAIVLGVVKSSRARLQALAPLDRYAREVAVKLRLYPVTEDNLQVLSPDRSIALDVLRATDKRVYHYAVERLADYLTAFETSAETLHTVTDRRAFAEILNELANLADPNLLGQTIAAAGAACRVTRLGDVPAAAWPHLVADDRTDPSFENVKGYLEEFGEVDDALGGFLALHQGITASDENTAEEKLDVTLAILRARRSIRSTETRVALAASIQYDPIPAASLEPEKGDLVARLLRRGLLADDTTAFAPQLMLDWATYEAAIAASKQYASFVDPGVLSVSLIPSLLGSSVIKGRAVREAVVDTLPDYLVGASPSQAQAVARSLNQHGWCVRFAGIEALRAAGVDVTELIELIAREGDELAVDDFRALLRAMGGSYARVAEGGRGRPTFPDDKSHRDALTRLVGTTINKLEGGTFKGQGKRLVAVLIQPRT